MTDDLFETLAAADPMRDGVPTAAEIEERLARWAA